MVRLDAPIQFQGSSNKMGFVLVEVERLFLEVPLLGQGGGISRKQQRQAQVTAVLQTGLSWDTCWEVFGSQSSAYHRLRIIPWFRCSPSAHRQPCTLCSPGNPSALMCR